MDAPIPILRIFDEAKAKEFYTGFLGLTVDWEHRFGENSPIYMQVSEGSCVIHLSEHFGDACPGSAMRIQKEALDEYCAVLRAKAYKNANPGNPQLMPWGTKDITITDPFGNRITFYELPD